MTDLFLFGSYTHSWLILVRIIYLYHSDLLLIADLLLYGSPVGHILKLVSDVYLFKTPKGHTYRISVSLILILILVLIFLKSPVGVHITYAHTKVPIGIKKLILTLRSLHLFGGTRRYYRDITKHILVLQNLFLYGSTRKYYLFKCPKRHELMLISNL